jgi:hypothetical protein
MKGPLFKSLCVILFCGNIGVLTVVPSYGESTMSSRPPLAREFGSKPGAYDLVIGVSQPIVDPAGRRRKGYVSTQEGLARQMKW